MTDEEIIKALEKRIESTENIKYGVNKMTMIDAQFLIDILDLIKRQKAEKEKLKIEICALSEKRITFPERLKIVKHAREHAIKEFAERLKANMSNIARMEYGGNTYFCVGYGLIDNLVKEMIESEVEENGK